MLLYIYKQTHDVRRLIGKDLGANWLTLNIVSINHTNKTYNQPTGRGQGNTHTMPHHCFHSRQGIKSKCVPLNIVTYRGLVVTTT